MRKSHQPHRLYSGSALLFSTAQRVCGALFVVCFIWLLSAWALGWL